MIQPVQRWENYGPRPSFTVTLKVWRQNGPDADGYFETFRVEQVNPEMSFLELLDTLNERLILETPEVRTAFARHGVVAMKADWTNRDDAIAAFLAAHGRYGIPFYMLYRPGREPLVYPELLTRDLVLRGLDELAAP